MAANKNQNRLKVMLVGQLGVHPATVSKDSNETT